MPYILLIIPALIVIHYIFFCFFKVTRCEITTDKISKDLKIVFISDLHGFTYGKRLYNKVKALNPDVILIGGDSVNKDEAESIRKVKPFICSLPEIAPTFYAFGNHEAFIQNLSYDNNAELKSEFNAFISSLRENNVWLLYKEVEYFGDMAFMPIDLPLSYYKKREIKPYDANEVMSSVIGDLSVSGFNIILAHNPCYAGNYAELNPDLILCGHTHGGLIRIPFIGAFLSPELTFFPKYSGGIYDIMSNGRKIKLIVSKGLGTHGFHIRIHNMAELIEIKLKKGESNE